jgi:hypothetical protein
MYREKKIIAVTPAGRKRYLEILHLNLVKFKGLIDEWHLWVNTEDEDDIKWMEDLSSQDFNYIKIIKNPHNRVKGNSTICDFFPLYNGLKDYVFIRFDDDIVFIDDNLIDLLDFRIDNPQYFLVYANLINNGINTHLLQRMGKIPLSISYNQLVEYNCSGQLAWIDSKVAENIHREFINNFDNRWMYLYDTWVLYNYERVSINCISWLSEEFNLFNGKVGEDEEQWLSSDYPFKIRKPNIMFGRFLVSHFAFWTQREHLDKTNILELYKNL